MDEGLVELLVALLTEVASALAEAPAVAEALRIFVHSAAMTAGVFALLLTGMACPRGWRLVAGVRSGWSHPVRSRYVEGRRGRPNMASRLAPLVAFGTGTWLVVLYALAVVWSGVAARLAMSTRPRMPSTPTT